MSTATRPGLSGLPNFDTMEIGDAHRLVHQITEEEVGAFSALSGHGHPLHMDRRFARRSPFGQRVVPGILTAAFVSRAHLELAGPGFAYVGQELRFPGPLFIGDIIHIAVTVVEKKEAKRVLIMDTMVRKQNGAAVLSGLSALKELSFA